MGDPRVGVVQALQRRLNEVGCGPLEADGVFGGRTRSAVLLFQTRYDLLPDGIVGPLTWEVLFRQAPVEVAVPPTPLLAAAVEAARGQRHVRETGPNRGPEVDEYLRAVGLDPAQGAYAWCIAFLYWCFREAARALDTANPCVRTAGVLNHWVRAPAGARIAAADALDEPSLVRPGAIFVIDHGHGLGHAGLVTAVVSGTIKTIEGNTNRAGSREGDGVYDKQRSIASINVGFVDYARPLTV
jgi:peptidoglycan hydrolase-like protein with peptidoglycan-binding domain